MKKQLSLIIICLLLLTGSSTVIGAQRDSVKITLTPKDTVLTIATASACVKTDTIKPKQSVPSPVPNKESGTSGLLLRLLTGAFLGMIGQGMRVIVGMRKKNKSASAFESSRLLISLMFGLVVGAVAGALVIVDDPSKELGTKTAMLAVITAGYAGADFIEGFLGNNKVTN